MEDLGLTHIALMVRDLDKSVSFYAKYAAMKVVHEREDAESRARVAWVSDGTRPFVIVLIQSRDANDTPLGPEGHLGVACSSREEVDALVEAARAEGILRDGPQDSGPPIGYWAFLADPDGNTLEISFGQEVAFTTEAAKRV